ncbi:cell division and transport-associated protein TolR [Bisgaardia hudsonensis]|uniref:Tol-Pal system protein TolR n=1 Tax=Bisgaardia hudsonensis TaxID=109472 RepID=A0A4R2N299_9PAST|nr:colicin uptake protein TolR [Bisgaardia hudsonensis]QLB12443.1 protein TolR [Bisgaardia hudsonensis]TCP13978.1 cell division and transport-associated protein TolR [Bisgaardia hudsonensis]
MSYRRNRNRRNIKSEINIVPFLDVLLVLVLIFMATAPIISQSVQVDLPDAVDSQSVSNEDKIPVILEVSGIGQYTLSISGERNEGLNEEMVTEISRQEFAKDNKTLFLVGGAKDIPYEEVIKALNLLHLAGIKSVGLMTDPI